MAGIFDVFTNKNAQDAANAQISGINAGVGVANPALAQGRDALTTNYTSGLQPFLQNYATANKGVSGLTDALGLTGDPSQVQARLAATPGYQFQLQQGNENVLRNASRTGQGNSGAVNLDLQKQGQGLADSTYQQYVQNLQPFLGAAGSAAGGIGNLSSGLGNQLNQNFGTTAQLGYTAATGAGNAQANADLANNAASANMWNAGMDVAKLAASAATGMPTGGGGGGFVSGAQNVQAGQGYGPGFDASGNQNPGFYAEGGKPPVGTPSVVGEKGPELFVPDKPGTVVPNDIVNKLMQFLPGQSLGGPAHTKGMEYYPGTPSPGPSSSLSRFLKAA